MRPLFRAVWMVTRPKVPSRPEHKTAAFRQFKPRKRADFVSLPVSVSHELRVENVDQVVAKAAKLGAKQQGPVSDMFWGDRCGRLVDPEGYTWYVATHIAEPTPAQMKKQMVEDMKKWQAKSEA